jgi:hypothetical protein
MPRSMSKRGGRKVDCDGLYKGYMDLVKIEHMNRVKRIRNRNVK